MNRTTQSLIAVVVALGAVTGYAASTGVGGVDDGEAKAAARLPVERTSLLCPVPSGSDLAETTYTAYTPKSSGAEGDGKAELVPVHKQLTDAPEKQGKDAKPFLTQRKQGEAVGGEQSGAEAPALIGTADGPLAPGWTVQQTTTYAAGSGRGAQGVNCTAPDTDFWFPGASSAKERSDYIHLTNPDDSAAVVDVELFGPDGEVTSEVGENIQVQPHSSVPVLLSTLADKAYPNLTMHVTARTGRVAAAVQSSDEKLGGDWLAAAADPASSAVLPGIPKDATSVRLVAFAPGSEDADLKIQLASPTGAITPAGHESLHVKGGMTAAVDLDDLTKGEAGSLLLSPTDKAVPVVAALRVTRGKGGSQETAFIPATAPVAARSTVADNRAKGSTLSLVAPEKSVEVRVTASPGTEGGSPAMKTYTVKGGTTLAVDPPKPQGLKGTYALTVETVSGGPVHGSRTLALPEGGIPMFTVQTLPDDRGTVSVPEAERDLRVLQK
ncbi:DUF5719 family protein [Streptomyces sp. A1499]|uniref:DUF5719 family protein n=1 Tax=Streptomyces sp. A1499 TaxID=2563104 RepID=UPI00109E77ED|nr:DUF5719 family protein [Streptomyces sp. A1499]THC46496.1 hypothetical protein E7X58_30475 [Streptomyces sp. A1499]